jgi:2-polyprenyl-3-methyl-5-hydroxy-6-metoxy-1,4-benzoquinol methylase
MRVDANESAADTGDDRGLLSEDYGSFASTQVRPRQRLSAMRRQLRRLRRRILDVDPHRLPAVAPGRLLEIGCGSGKFLAGMKQRGWDVAGIEASPLAAASAQAAGLAVWSGRLECAADPAEHYDLVVGWEVLEHLHDPVAALEKLARWTVPRGWLALSVPDAGSIDFAIFKAAWYGLDFPRHLFHFTLPTLTVVLRRGGWDIERFSGTRTRRTCSRASPRSGRTGDGSAGRLTSRRSATAGATPAYVWRSAPYSAGCGPADA